MDRTGAIVAAVIGAAAVIVAALINAHCSSQHIPSETGVANTPSANQPSVTTQSSPSPMSASERQEEARPAENPNRVLYEEVAEVAEGKSYIDKETNFVFAVDEITNGLFKGMTTGVLCRYTLPDGTFGDMFRRQVGDRTDFQYQGRKFFMVIEDVDYDRKVAKIRIREMR